MFANSGNPKPVSADKIRFCNKIDRVLGFGFCGTRFVRTVLGIGDLAMPSIDDSKCILITGATSGIGRALALDLVKLPSKPQVIGAGRRKERLEELAKADLHAVSLNLSVELDVLKKSVDDLLARFPALDTVILNAGIQLEVDVKKGIDMSKIMEEFNVNYVSVVALITYMLPHFLELSDQGRPSFIITVTSGLGIIPGPAMANYSASKAALHSFSTSLRAQLHDTNVQVIEIIPPLVESELHDAQGTTEKLSKFWMPLEDFTKEAIEGLRKGDHCIPVGPIKGTFDQYERGKEEIALHMLKRKQALDREG